MIFFKSEASIIKILPDLPFFYYSKKSNFPLDTMPIIQYILIRIGQFQKSGYGTRSFWFCTLTTISLKK